MTRTASAISGRRRADGRSAAERLEEEDRLRPEPDDPRRRPPEVRRAGQQVRVGGGDRDGDGDRGAAADHRDPEPGGGLSRPRRRGRRCPDFAAPLATGDRETMRRLRRQRLPEARNAGGGQPAACEFRGEGVVNMCEAREQAVVLSSSSTAGAECNFQIDQVERVRPEFPEVNFVAVYVTSGGARSEVEQIVRRRGWTMPVGVDTDGAVHEPLQHRRLPHDRLRREGGKVRNTKIGKLSEDDLAPRGAALVGSG